MRHATVATACRARVVVSTLAVVTLVLGLLGAASFSVYHKVPISVPPSDITTSADQTDNHTSSYISYDVRPEVVTSACVTGSNQTDCSTAHALMNTGYCGPSYVILSALFLRCYLVVHSLIYPVCLVAVLVLYSLIYKTVLVQRGRRMEMRGRAKQPTSPPTPLVSATAGRFLLLLIGLLTCI